MIRSIFILSTLVLLALLAVTANLSAAAQEGTSIAGMLVEDRDGGGERNAVDGPAETLVELAQVSDGRVISVTSLISDASGGFEFIRAPRSDYVLLVWWSPGFINPPPQSSPSILGDEPASYVLQIDLSADGVTNGAFHNLEFLLEQKPEGLVPYPVRVGQGTLPIGRAVVQVGGLPDTGMGGSGTGSSWIPLALALFVLGLAGLIVAPQLKLLRA